MTPTRREFIKRLGISLVALAAGQQLFTCRYAERILVSLMLGAQP
jgi:hypothetical protein